MSEVRMKIKELATELEVQPKEVLEAVRQFGMAAKSVQGSVSLDEAERLRNHFVGLKQPAPAAKPSVIVRRRRKDAEPAAPEVAEAPAAPVAEEAPAPEESKAAALASTPAPAEVAVEEKAPEASAAPVAEAVADTPEAEVQDTAVAAEETPAQDTESETPSPEDTPSDKNTRSRKRDAKVASTPARVISRPLEENAEKAEMAGEKAEEAPAPEPKVRKRSEVLDAITAKDKPVVEESEKAPVAEQAGESKPVQQDAAPAAQPAEGQRARILPRPDASAVPEGSSAPSLPIRPARPVQEEAQDDGEAAPKAQDNAPKVRIISRPTAPATPRQPQQPGDRRREGGRDGGRDGGRPPRSGQGDGNFRERSGGGFRQQAPAEPMPDSRDGQSKKKRNKGRRTVDFQAGDVFGRHEEEVTQMNRQRGKRKPGRQQAQSAPVTQPVKAAKRKIRFAEAITVADMAKQMGLKANELIKVLFGMGVMATINQSLDMDTATLLASEFEYEVEKTGFSEEEYLLPKEEDTPESLKSRPPVVTIMGHVDHGKTSLLDAIRKSHVTSGEAGGITQHIGAYHVKTKRGNIVFLDTPGHEAFTAMRARGAQITDLVILVVAADDGVMEQTREAVNHSRAANVPIMVAVNKMDKPGANPDRVLRELAEMGLQPEDWGGDTIVGKVSAKTGEGLDELLEMVALQSEIMELKANPDKPARGHIVEARLDKGRGAVATVLIQEGTLRHGDNFVCGTHAGRVRALLSDQGKKVKEAGPSIPVEVQGFDGVPEAGEEFVVVADDKVARRIADTRAAKQRERALAAESRVTLESFLSSRADDQEAVPLNLVLKADVQGSLEAITEAVNKLSTPKVQVHVVHGGTGAISESDILLASASRAIIIGFNVRPTAKVKDVAEHEGVDIRYYDIIYKLVEDMQSAMAGLLAPVQREVYLGQAEVRQTYNVPKVGLIAGCFVADGKIMRNAGVRLLRDGVVVYTGKIASLKRFKDDAKEVAKGNECGAGLENFNDVKIGDIIEAFETVEEAATL